MFRNIKISTKIAFHHRLSLVAIVAISTFTYRQRSASAGKISLTLNTVADQRALLLNNYFDNLKSTLVFLQTNAFANIVQDSTSEVSPEKHCRNPFNKATAFSGYVTNTKGHILHTSDSTTVLRDPDNTFFASASGGISFSPIQHDNLGDFMLAGAPFEGNILVIRIDLQSV